MSMLLLTQLRGGNGNKTPRIILLADAFLLLLHFTSSSSFIIRSPVEKRAKLQIQVQVQLQVPISQLLHQSQPPQRKQFLSTKDLAIDDEVENYVGYNLLEEEKEIKITKSWLKRYDELKSFYDRNGHCNVPRKEKGLGSWVQKQRAAYKLYQQLQPVKAAIDKSARSNSSGDQGRYNNEMNSETRKIESKIANSSYGNRPTPLNEKQIYLLNDLDFIWNVHEWKYQLNLKTLEAFYKKYGHINIPSSSLNNSSEGGEYDRQLYKWLYRQKEEYRKYLNGIDCKLTDKRRQALENLGFYIGMFDVDADDDSTTSVSTFRTFKRTSWEGRFKELSEFIVENGHCNIPRDDEKYSQLSGWVQHQRAEKKKKKRGSKSRLTDEKERRLNEIGFVWSIQDKIWNERLNELREFKLKHSHVRVPTKRGKLGNWVMIQRLQYSNRRKGEKHTLTDERIKALNKLGFEWDIHEVSWEEKFTTLRECIQNYDDRKDNQESISSYITKHAPHLLPWVSAQRAEKRYKTQGLTSHLTDERENKLNEINFDWSADEDRKRHREASWMGNFEQLKKYKKDHGTCRVPAKKDQTNEEKSFSHWVRDQRRYFKAFEKDLKAPMTQERRDLLLSIGFADDITL